MFQYDSSNLEKNIIKLDTLVKLLKTDLVKNKFDLIKSIVIPNFIEPIEDVDFSRDKYQLYLSILSDVFTIMNFELIQMSHIDEDSYQYIFRFFYIKYFQLYSFKVTKLNISNHL